MTTNSERSVTYKILDHIGVLATYKNNWSKELNLIQWNDRSPKFDIRDWDAEHEHMSRGITLHEDEARELSKLLGARFEDMAPVNSEGN